MVIANFKAENFKPSKKRLLVILDPIKELTESKLIKPPEFSKKLAEELRKPFGTIVCLGEEVKTYKVGERVYFAEHSGRSIESGTNIYLLLHEEEIFGSFINEGAN